LTNKIAISGASGFFGSTLALKLLMLGYDVALLTRPKSDLYRLIGSVENFVIKPIYSDSDVSNFVTEYAPDIIIHTAALYGRKSETLVDLCDANIRLGLLLIQAASNLQQKCTFINTGTTLNADINFYASTKNFFAENGKIIVNELQSRLSFINVLLQHVYGPGDDTSKFTTKVFQSCLKNDPYLNLTSGLQRRDFIFINDAVAAYVAIVENIQSFPRSSDIDVGSGVSIPVKDFVELTHKLCHSKTKLKFGANSMRLNERLQYQADVTALKDLGWKPQFSLKEGIRQTLKLEAEIMFAKENP
jgi:CDP-paratose synthetase